MDSHGDRVKARLKDIREHPERHQHDFNGLSACCVVDGVFVIRLQEAHEGISSRMNGGRRCDVTSGPCSCGAWH